MPTRAAARGFVFVAIAAAAWGAGGVVAAVLYRATGLGPVAVSFWRTVIGVLLLAAVWRPRSRPAGPRRWWVSPVTGVGLALYQTAYYAAVACSGVAVATVLTLGSAPILIAVAARFVIGERLGVAGAIAVGVAPVGLTLVVGVSGVWGLRSAAGVGLALLSAAGYAAVTVLHRKLGVVDPARTTLHGFVVAGVCLAPLAVLEGLWPSRGDLTETLVLLGFLGLFSTAVAYSLFFASLGALRATTVSMVSLIEPVTGAALAVVFLGEHVTARAVAGGVILLGSVVVSSWREPAR
jgi:drug/metabolite transporter, DME family